MKPSESSPPVARWKCLCAYDGTDFSGWQSQRNAPSVQDAIEERLRHMFQKEVRVHGSGRTDAGVHARGQVFHFDAAWPHRTEQLLAALRTGLPASIQIRSARPVSAEFHARFSATGKEYRYELVRGFADPFRQRYAWSVPQPLDLTAMEQAAALLTGRHDFRAFTALNGPAREDTVKELRRLELRCRGRRCTVIAEADGFLYKMVRSLVGTLVAAGLGRFDAEGIRRCLRTGERTALVQTAPAHGLFLERVFY